MEIPVGHGLITFVDDEDFPMLSHWTWGIDAYGYVRRAVRVRGRFHGILMHRQLMLPDPGQDVDHINGDKLDNRKANLRPCTRRENVQNQRKFHGTSQYKGVYWDRRNSKWTAKLTTGGRQFYLGLFSDEIEAARAYDAKAREMYGEFSRVNFEVEC
jgi:hypothetical protein